MFVSKIIYLLHTPVYKRKNIFQLIKQNSQEKVIALGSGKLVLSSLKFPKDLQLRKHFQTQMTKSIIAALS